MIFDFSYQCPILGSLIVFPDYVFGAQPRTLDYGPIETTNLVGGTTAGTSNSIGATVPVQGN